MHVSFSVSLHNRRIIGLRSVFHNESCSFKMFPVNSHFFYERFCCQWFPQLLLWLTDRLSVLHRACLSVKGLVSLAVLMDHQTWRFETILVILSSHELSFRTVVRCQLWHLLHRHSEDLLWLLNRFSRQIERKVVFIGVKMLIQL